MLFLGFVRLAGAQSGIWKASLEMEDFRTMPRTKRRTRGSRRVHPRARRVSHARRADVTGDEVLLVTCRVQGCRPSLREAKAMRVLVECFRRGKRRFGFRLVHYVVLRNHVHFICEAEDRRALTRGIQGLKIRMAKGLNRLWQRKGRVWEDRYHVTASKSPASAMRMVRYVLDNYTRHLHESPSGLTRPVPWGDRGRPDPCSSASWLRWRVMGVTLPRRSLGEPPVVEARGAALVAAGRLGWMRLGGYMNAQLDMLHHGRA